MAVKPKSSKAKRNAILFKLKSTVSGFFYTARRNPKQKPDKMAFRKYDPIVRKHVLFKETKISS